MVNHVSFPGLGINDLVIKKEAFSVFGISVAWYGVIIALGILLCLILATRDCPKYKLSDDDFSSLFIVALISGFTGARIYYVLFSWDQYKNDLMRVFDIREGGLAFYGGVIGGAIGIILFCMIKKLSLRNWLDFIVVYLPLGQAIGRWGNFVNQEAFGTNTKMPWGMISEETKRYLSTVTDVSVDPNLPVHPTFLYEFIGNLIIFFILLHVRKHSKYNLETCAWYFMLYGALRFFVESIRTDALYIGNTNLRVSMVVSFAMFFVGIATLMVFRILDRKEKLPQSWYKNWDSEEKMLNNG